MLAGTGLLGKRADIARGEEGIYFAAQERMKQSEAE